MQTTSPIVASLHYENAGVHIVRLSGKGVDRIVLGQLPKEVDRLPERQQVYTLIQDQNSQTIDDVLICFFKGPRSYTGEDLIEISCHGSPFISQKIVQLFITLGCRLAEPGEFTKRAFLNEKIDLTKAEGIRDLTQSMTEHQYLAARDMASGRLLSYIEALRERVIQIFTFLQANIDFPDEAETGELDLAPAFAIAAKVQQDLQMIYESYASSVILRQGLSVAIIGRPNAGKSTLLNALLRDDRAIISDLPGTTRDFIREQMIVQGRLIQILDTAGVRQTADPIEQEGIKKVKDLCEKAHVVIVLLPKNSTQAEKKELDQFVEPYRKKSWFIVTKSDLEGALPPYLEMIPASEHFSFVSPRANEEVKRFEDLLVSHFDEMTHKDFPVRIYNMRHVQAVEKALASLDAFFEPSKAAEPELLAFEMQAVMKDLQEITGEVSTDTVFDQIFSTFCLGK